MRRITTLGHHVEHARRMGLEGIVSKRIGSYPWWNHLQFLLHWRNRRRRKWH
jgi:hypothetical protein